MNNFSIQNQMDFFLIRTNIYKSLSQRFIFKKNVQFIHDGIFTNSISNWEYRLISYATTLAYNHSINELKHG